MIHCPVTISALPRHPPPHTHFFPFNSTIPPKTVGTEKSQNSQPSNGYVPRVGYNLNFCSWVCPGRLYFHSHKPGQGRYLSESSIKNIHTPKNKNDQSRLGKPCGRWWKRRATSLISRTVQHFLKVLLLDWLTLEIPLSQLPHWTGLQVPLINGSTLNTVFHSLIAVCDSMLLRHLFQIKILTLSTASMFLTS